MFKEVNTRSSRGNDWTDVELRSSVTAYIEMLKKQLEGMPTYFSDALSLLQENELSQRSLWSIKLRMQNISSVLYGLKLPILQDCGISHNIGSGIKERVISMLYETGINELEPFKKTANRLDFERRVTILRTYGGRLAPVGSLVPHWELRNVKSYFRSPDVKAWVLENSNGICEGCGKSSPFIGLDGFPYLQVHHVLPLSENGSDTISNTVALCPNCHMRCHHSIDRDEFRLELYQSVKRLALELPDSNIDTTSRQSSENNIESALMD